jgi:hypothetical protein
MSPRDAYFLDLKYDNNIYLENYPATTDTLTSHKLKNCQKKK